jgi:hypothetical protein
MGGSRRVEKKDYFKSNPKSQFMNIEIWDYFVL